MANDSIESALEIFASTGPEFGGGLSNHGPMAAEALVSLGRGEAVEEWSAWYARKLTDPPESRNAIDASAWREALGDIGRAGDWAAFFRRELDERPWREAVMAWLPRLAPGIMAGATHGILRTAHAVRSLERGETLARRTELADGLAYWAARYQTLPSAPGAAGVLDVPDALRLVPHVRGVPGGGLIFERVRAVADTEFATAVNHVSLDTTLDAFVSRVTRTFVRWYLANAARDAIAFVHTVTAPSALRILAPYVHPAHERDVMRYAWQACAAVYAVYGRHTPADEPPPGDTIDAEDVIGRAVATRDEHAIKFTDACLREHELTGDDTFLVAAFDAVSRLRAG